VFLNRRVWSSLVVGALVLLAGCGPDRRRDQCVAAHPNFVVLITAPTGKALPADLTVTLHYGGSSTEEYRLNQSGTQQVLFCRTAALDGGVITVADGAAPSSADALRCELWTGGPATLDIAATSLAPTTQDLTPLASSCPLDVTIPLSEADAG
jgi:hypothetical protein